MYVSYYCNFSCCCFPNSVFGVDFYLIAPFPDYCLLVPLCCTQKFYFASCRQCSDKTIDESQRRINLIFREGQVQVKSLMSRRLYHNIFINTFFESLAFDQRNQDYVFTTLIRLFFHFIFCLVCLFIYQTPIHFLRRLIFALHE